MKIILVKPLITEKNTAIQEKLNQYSFEVGIKTNKLEIAKAVEDKFNVRVKEVNTLISKGKKKSQMTKKGRFEGHRADRKKLLLLCIKKTR